jgi:hypothetical protein
MAIYEITANHLKKVPETSFAAEGIRERDDIQRLLRNQIEIIAPDVLVVAEEFGEWEDSKRRIDLLAIDRNANLVVIELKRTDDGGHMELQALRYAAMVSTLTFDKVVEIYGNFLKKMGDDTDPAVRILEFLDWDEPLEDAFAQDTKIVLASKEFSKELTTAVIWLNQRGLDIRCIRMSPYKDGNKVLLDIQTVIPLPEAEDYQVKFREKQQKERFSRAITSKAYTKYDVIFPDHSTGPLPKRGAIFAMVKYLCEQGVSPEAIHKVLAWRGNGLWRAVDGAVKTDTFHALASEAAASGGLAFDHRRWYYSDDDLITFNKKTYAFTKMWGHRTDQAMQELLEAFPDKGVSFNVVNS